MKKLSSSEKAQIVGMYKDGYPKSYIAKMVKRSVSTVSGILRLAGVDPQLLRLRIWDEAYLWYQNHEERNSKILWRDLPQEKKEDFYRLVEPMVRVEAEYYLQEIGFSSVRRTLKELEDENAQLKRLLMYYMSRISRIAVIP